MRYKVLFLQPKKYFVELGVNFHDIDATFLVYYSFNLKEYLLNFDLIVSCLDHELSSRKIIGMANNLSICTLYLMDGVYDFSNATLNKQFTKNNIQLLSPCIYGNVFTLEEGFKEYLSNKNQTTCFQYLPLRAKLEITQKKKRGVLLTTAKTPYFNDDEFSNLVYWFKEIVHFFEQHEIEYFARIFDSRLLEKLPAITARNIVDEDLSIALSSAEVVLCTPSTVIFSAYHYNIPCVILNYRDDTVYYDSDYNLTDLSFLNEAIGSCKRRDCKYMDDNRNKLYLSQYNFSLLEGWQASENISFYFNASVLARYLYVHLPPNFKSLMKRLYNKWFDK